MADGSKPVEAGQDEYAGLGDVTASVKQDDPYAGLGDETPGAGAKAAALGQSIAKSAADVGGPIAGMTMGAALGGLTGPLAPVAVPVGAAIGAGAGFLAGRGLTNLFDLKRPEELPPEVRPYAYGGEVVGGAVPFTGATIGAAKLGFRAASPFINRILDYAGAHPLAFGLSETGSSITSGLYGAASEEARPGEAVPRFAAETAAGFLSPYRLLSSTFTTAASGVKRVVSMLSPAARETAAGGYLTRLVQEFGEDPEALATLLSKPDLVPGLTSAQKTGSDALSAVEQMLARDSLKFGHDAAAKAETSMAAMRNLIQTLKGTGDPAALQEAGRLQANYFKALIAGRVQMAEAEATQAASKITADTPQARQTLSTQAVDLVRGALDDARKAEAALWDKVPTDVPSTAENVIKAADDLKARMLPEEKLPDLVERFVSRVSGDGEVANARQAAEALFGGPPVEAAATNSGELKILRSRMLTAAREADAQGRYGDAAAFGKVADAALTDLKTAFENTGDSAFDDARKFTAALHDTFSRTFANSATATTRSGAERIPPEALLSRAMGTGRVQGDLRLQELADAVKFPVTEAGVSTPEALARIPAMADAQERLVRLTASEAIDPQTGRVSTTRLSNFLRNNADILDNFPKVRDDIEAAVRSEGRAKELVAAYEGGQKVIDKSAAFSKVLGVDSATDAVAKAVNSASPETELTRYVKMAREGGSKAVDGLRSALVEQAINKSTKGDVLDFDALDKALNEPMRAGLPSVVDVMAKNGVVDAGFRDRLNTIIETARRVNASQDAASMPLRGNDATPSPLIDSLVRIVGSKIGGHVSEALVGGSTLIANSVGSKYLAEMYRKMGGKSAQTILIKAAEDPQFMALLLRKPANAQQELEMARNVHAYLLSAGLSTAKETPPEKQPAK